jgi:hypothetical protein
MARYDDDEQRRDGFDDEPPSPPQATPPSGRTERISPSRDVRPPAPTPPRGNRNDYADRGEEEYRPAQRPSKAAPPPKEAQRQQRQARPMPPPPPAQYVGLNPDDVPDYPQRRRLPTAERPPRRENGFYLPWWSLLVLVCFVGAAAIGAWAVVSTLGGNTQPGGDRPQVVVVTATFTAGPPPTFTPIGQVAPPLGGSTPLPTPPPLPTIVPTKTLPPGEFKLGATVQVVEVGITGLNVRSGAGTDAAVRFIAPEGSTWILKSGPQQASGLEWWELQDPDDATRTGWAARQFLQAVTTP